MRIMKAFWMRVVRGDATKEQAKDTGMALVLIFMLVWLLRGRRDVYVAAAFVVQLLNMIAPQIFRPAAVVWFGLSLFLGAVISRVILSVVFFAVVTPIGLVRRMLGVDVMKLRAFKAGPTSVMIKRDHTYTGKDIEHPY